MPTTSELHERQGRPESWLIRIARTGLIASLYVVITYSSSLLNLAYGPFQFRLSECLTLLPLIWSEAVMGVTIGTLLSNLASPYGVFDWIFGTLSTFIAVTIVHWLGSHGFSDWLAAIAVSITNALIVPFVLIFGASGMHALSQLGSAFWTVYLSYAGSIFVGEFSVTAILGIPLFRTIKGRVLK
nr:QueT transporter family protein [Coprothermobacter platensis]